MAEQRNIVAEIKDKVRIEDVINEDEPLQTRRGRWLRGQRHDSLVVDTREQRYWWNGNGNEHGDVISWKQKRLGVDFQGACDWLCQKYGIRAPEWGREDHATRVAARLREETLDVAMRVFQAWLRGNAEAMAYLHGRGLTDETIERERLGYSGEGTEGERHEMIAELRKAGVSVDTPTAVAVLGMKGDVGRWGQTHKVEVGDWMERGSIPGMVGGKGIVFAHMRHGRVVYMSRRGIAEKRHYNLPIALVGARQPYYNSVYATGEGDVVVVEGQLDAISLGQWGVGGVALAGTHMSAELAEGLNKHETVYLGMDADQAGQIGASGLVSTLEPMTRIVEWGGDTCHTFADGGGQDRQVKDGNDLLKALIQGGVGVEEQPARVRALMQNAKTIVEHVCAWAGEQKGADRDKALQDALLLVARMEKFQRDQYRGALAKSLGLLVREFDNLVRTTMAMTTGKGEGGEPVYTLGGEIRGWLVEYIYDPENHQGSLVWRDPDGRVHTGEGVTIEGTRYVAMPPTQTVQDGGVLFPSALGPLKPTRELVTYIEMFIRSAYLLPRRLDSKIMAYYALLTWIYDSFNTLPYLRAMGEPGAGKSELLRRVGLVCYRLMSANGAGTAASLFRSVERYRGTVFVDEMDLRDSDAANDIIKFLNLGAMKGNPIWRLEEVMGADGRKEYVERTYQTFCPKLISMQREFRDLAVGSRALTFKLQPRETIELIAAKVPLEINNDMRNRAANLRNMLLRWRMEHWKPEIEINPDFYDLDVSSRLNQVTGPLLSIAQDDPELQAEMRGFLRDYYQEQVLSRSMTIAARIIEALWKIQKYPDLRKTLVKVDPSGDEKILVMEVTKIANDIINEMNRGDDDDDDDDDKDKGRHNKKDELSPHRIGRILREDLQLQVSQRSRRGYYVYWDQVRMEGLAKRFGVKPEDMGPQVEPPVLKQGKLEGA